MEESQSTEGVRIIKIFTNRHSRAGGCRKKQKSVEPQRHQDTKEAFFVCWAKPEQARKKLCVSVTLWLKLS